MGGRRGGSARAAWGAWQSGEGSSAQQRAVGEVPRDAWGSLTAGGGLGAAQSGGRSAAGGRRRGKQGSRLDEEEKVHFAISENSRDQTVKQR